MSEKSSIAGGKIIIISKKMKQRDVSTEKTSADDRVKAYTKKICINLLTYCPKYAIITVY